MRTAFQILNRGYDRKITRQTAVELSLVCLRHAAFQPQKNDRARLAILSRLLNSDRACVFQGARLHMGAY